MQAEQERCNTMEGLFTILNKLNPQTDETVRSLQFYKSVRQPNENVEEWEGRLKLAAVECNYTEMYRQLKEQFIHGLNDNDILVIIIRELTKTEESKDVESKEVLAWAEREETQ